MLAHIKAEQRRAAEENNELTQRERQNLARQRRAGGHTAYRVPASSECRRKPLQERTSSGLWNATNAVIASARDGFEFGIDQASRAGNHVASAFTAAGENYVDGSSAVAANIGATGNDPLLGGEVAGSAVESGSENMFVKEAGRIGEALLSGAKQFLTNLADPSFLQFPSASAASAKRRWSDIQNLAGADWDVKVSKALQTRRDKSASGILVIIGDEDHYDRAVQMRIAALAARAAQGNRPGLKVVAEAADTDPLLAQNPMCRGLRVPAEDCIGIDHSEANQEALAKVRQGVDAVNGFVELVCTIARKNKRLQNLLPTYRRATHYDQANGLLRTFHAWLLEHADNFDDAEDLSELVQSYKKALAGMKDGISAATDIITRRDDHMFAEFERISGELNGGVAIGKIGMAHVQNLEERLLDSEDLNVMLFIPKGEAERTARRMKDEL